MIKHLEPLFNHGTFVVSIFRNSLLTSILRDSLGGNCLTTMLATISLCAFNLEVRHDFYCLIIISAFISLDILLSRNCQETISTCRFAQRVALIKNDLKLNLETDIQSENALLRAENERLKQQIKALTKQTVQYLYQKFNLVCKLAFNLFLYFKCRCLKNLQLQIK